MNALQRICAVAGMFGLATLTVAPVSASQIANTISGTVTAPVTGNQITVNGVPYHINESKQTDEALSKLNVGDHVDLMLSAPAAKKGVAVNRIVAQPSSRNAAP